MKRKHLIPLFLTVLLISILVQSSTCAIASDYEPNFDNQETIGEFIAKLDIPTNETTVFDIIPSKNASNDFFSNDSVNATYKYEPSFIKFSTTDGCEVTETYVYCANDEQNGEIIFADFSLYSGSPHPTSSGSVADYMSSFLPKYDYYFVLGCSYSSLQISGKYAIRPSAMWSNLRAESTATVSISSTNFFMGMHGYPVDSSGNLIYSNYELFPLDCPTYTRTPPTLNSMDYISLYTCWANSGFSSTDYLWMPTAVCQMNLVFEVFFSDGNYSFIEHNVYSPF